MILDYKYHQKSKDLSISYIRPDGSKKIERFRAPNGVPSYVRDEEGQCVNWDGSRCSRIYRHNPQDISWSDLLGLIRELETDNYSLLKNLPAKTHPRLYAFDIETMIDPKIFPDPATANFPITNISIVNDKLEAVVLGTRELSSEQEQHINQRYSELLSQVPFYKEINSGHKYRPGFRYLRFESEYKMLEFFLIQIVSKAPVLAGWNSLFFDWQYIQNRVMKHMNGLEFSLCSPTQTLSSKNITDQHGNKVKLLFPDHTLVWDMMDIICTYDMAVMPIKENRSLDYIASSSIGQGKIEYKGNLDDLYKSDYETYVFYNTIDSVLVALLDKRFRTTSVLYGQALICKNRISTSLSKIAITESMFFDYFWNKGIRIVPSESKGHTESRGELIGAYVRQPVPGKHMFVCCNDFASLYPSVIISNNLSIENYQGHLGDTKVLPSGKEVLITPELIERYKKAPGYFVSVNNNIYKTDKDYAFKNIQMGLKVLRSKSKYLGKKLDAIVASDLEHILNKRQPSQADYPQDIISELKTLTGQEIRNSEDLCSIENKSAFGILLREHIDHLSNQDLSTKLIMNSMYGGSSHVYFEWFNMGLANDITGEGRNLIHIMENTIPAYIQRHWPEMTELHQKLGITLNSLAQKYQNLDLSKIEDLTTKDRRIFCQPVAGDTDSIYFCYEGLLSTIEGSDKMSITKKAQILADFNTLFLNDFNKQTITNYYKSRLCERDIVHEFELETISYSEIRLSVKKRYSQMLIWKDGKMYDEDHMKSKTKGLEMVKASYPSLARTSLTELSQIMLLDTSPSLSDVLNKKMQELKDRWYSAELTQICPSISVSNYDKYVISDTDPTGIIVRNGCPFSVRGLAYYNWLRHNMSHAYKDQVYKDEPVYGGKLQYYIVKTNPRDNVHKSKKSPDTILTFDPDKYPSWGPYIAPIDRGAMFKKCILDPFNRILEAAKMQPLALNGTVQLTLFS